MSHNEFYRPKGIKRVLNSCYAAAAINLLMSSPMFREKIKNDALQPDASDLSKSLGDYVFSEDMVMPYDFAFKIKTALGIHHYKMEDPGAVFMNERFVDGLSKDTHDMFSFLTEKTHVCSTCMFPVSSPKYERVHAFSIPQTSSSIKTLNLYSIEKVKGFFRENLFCKSKEGKCYGSHDVSQQVQPFSVPKILVLNAPTRSDVAPSSPAHEKHHPVKVFKEITFCGVSYVLTGFTRHVSGVHWVTEVLTKNILYTCDDDKVHYSYFRDGFTYKVGHAIYERAV